MSLGHGQRVRIVLNRDGQAKNIPQVRTRIGACPAGKVLGGIDNLTRSRIGQPAVARPIASGSSPRPLASWRQMAIALFSMP